MSVSSRRSTRSSLSIPNWRSGTFLSASPPAPASISNVLAEPTRAEQSVTAEQSLHRVPSFHREREDQQAVTPSPENVSHSSSSSMPQEEAINESVATLRPIERENVPAPTAQVPLSDEQQQPDPASTSAPAPEEPAKSSLSTVPEIDKSEAKALANSSWFATLPSLSVIGFNKSSDPSSLPKPPTSASSIASVDSTVPSRKQSPPPPPTPDTTSLNDDPSQLARSNGQVPTLKSLNPSTSRFTLALPLLGRPKVPLDQALQDQSDGQSTWWDYVGWKSTSEPALATNAPEESDLITPKAEIPQPDIISPPATTDPRSTSSSPTPAVHDSSLSVNSANTNVSAATWYSPWTWSSGAAASTSNIPQQGPSEAEQIREQYERDRRDSAPPAIQVEAPTPQKPRPASTGEIKSNPIESSIISNSSNWASFFVGKGLGSQKKLVDSSHDGMEVMDVPDDVDAQGTSRGRPETPPPSAKTIPPKSTQKSSPETSRSPVSRSPLSADGKNTATPLTNTDSVKRKDAESSSSTKAGGGKKPPPAPKPARPNLMLPTWEDTFLSAPRSLLPTSSTSTSALSRGIKLVNSVLFQQEADAKRRRAKQREKEMLAGMAMELPRAFEVTTSKGKMPQTEQLEDILRGVKRVVVVGVHGWFPGGIVKTLTGEPTGTSEKFADMMIEALEKFQKKHNVKLEKITRVPLSGQGTIAKRVETHYDTLMSNKEWVADLHSADAVIVSAHSQGSIVSNHLLDRLIREGHIITATSVKSNIQEAIGASGGTGATMGPGFGSRKAQKVVCMCMCGIHLGPLRYLSSSSLMQQYFQYFETVAARELFEFQNTESAVSKDYVKALSNVLHHRVKMVYVASLNDQVVGLYSGLFTAATHPLILRGLYIDGDAYQSTDFLSNLLVLLLRVLNSGISDSGLLTHLSEATAGTLSGVGHSSIYDELSVYQLAVDYLFLVDDGQPQSDLVIESFNANTEQNDYEIPWALRDVIADERVAYFFSKEIVQLRDEFRHWQPKTAILREVKRKLQPIQRLPAGFLHTSPVSKL